jgi:hypothetical protein
MTQPTKSVISTEGGALRRRSGETPAFAFAFLFVIPQRSEGICF